MSARSWKERIEDVLEAIAEIQAFTRSMSFADFRGDARTLKAVALNFVIIGEATARVPDEITTAHPEIAWRFMRGIRNRLVHDYFAIDAQIVWDTIQNDLPALIEPLNSLLHSD